MIENISTIGQVWYYNATSGEHICEVNAFKLLDTVQKYPKIVFWLAIAILGAVLLDRFVMPQIRKRWEKIYLAVARIPDTIIYVCAPALAWFAAFTTFHITEEISRYYIETPLMIILGLSLLYIIWKKRHAIKAGINEEEEKDDPTKPGRNN